jgi:DeoR/GlpR family transcriptional regulator of sugar metabolism
LGGTLRESELSFIGHLTEKSLDELNADKVILGTRALDLEQGLTNDYLPETLTDRAILKIGRTVIVVADHTKCGVVSTAALATLDAMHTLVTDRDTKPKFIAALRARGIKIITA